MSCTLKKLWILPAHGEAMRIFLYVAKEGIKGAVGIDNFICVIWLKNISVRNLLLCFFVIFFCDCACKVRDVVA